MKKEFIYVCTAISFVLLCGCEKELMSEDLDVDVPIIEAYISAGDSTVNFNVSKLIPFTTDGEAHQLPISGLSVSFKKNGSSFTLSESTSLGNYQYTGTGYNALPGDLIEMSFSYNSKLISTSTVIPEKPVNATVSPGLVYLEGLEEGEFGPSLIDPIKITWDNHEGHFYFLKIDYIESTPDLVNENLADQDIPTSTTTELLNNGIYEIKSRNIYFFGTYRIILYKTNQEYADLFETINQSSQNLTDPVSNIDNGWGIFTGLNADTLYLEVDEL